MQQFNKAIAWYANRYGYHIDVIVNGKIVSDYSAGNHPSDSEEFLEPSDPAAVPEPKLREFAVSTAQQLAEEFNVPLDCISEID
jgi:hypothetical protein